MLCYCYISQNRRQNYNFFCIYANKSIKNFLKRTEKFVYVQFLLYICSANG